MFDMRNYQICVSSWQIATFPGSKTSTVLHLPDDKVFPDLKGHDGDEAVVNEDPLAGRQNLSAQRED